MGKNIAGDLSGNDNVFTNDGSLNRSPAANRKRSSRLQAAAEFPVDLQPDWVLER